VLQQVDCLAEIKTLNCQLERLSPQLRVSKVRFSKQSPMAAEHSRARKLAVNLHEVFQANLQDISSCACNTPHNVSLRLPRVREPATESSATPIPIRFEVLFPLDSKLPDAGTSWRGLEFQPLTAMPSSPVSPRNSTVAASRDDATDQKAGATRRKMVEGLRGLFGTKSSGSRTPTSSTPCTPSPTSSPAPHHSPATPTDITRGATVRFATDPSFVAAVPSESVMLSSDYSNAESIGNLCYAIQKAGSRKPGAASASVLVGALLGKENIRWNCLQPTMSFPFETIRAVPLDAVLLTGALKLDVKLRLGVQIALAMMQLHTTQWLGDDWGTKDIFILHRAATRQQVGSNQHVEIWEPILEHAFVHCTFDGQPRRLSVAESVADYNRSLFSLGVVLIELALGKPIEKLRGRVTVDCGGNALESCADPVRTTAVDCLGRVYSSQALAYGDAVERCINGLRLAEPIPKDLNDPRYKNEVQVEIVSALERNLAVRNDSHPSATLVADDGVKHRFTLATRLELPLRMFWKRFSSLDRVLVLLVL